MNGLRAALVMHPVPDEPDAEDKNDIFLVVQNVTQATIRLHASDAVPNPRRLIWRDNGVLETVAAPKPDSAYGRSGMPLGELGKQVEWSEAETKGLRLGIHIPNDAVWRTGEEVNVELWIKNTGDKDAMFEFPGRNDFGLRVLMTDKEGREHEAGFTIMWLKHHFMKLLLPPEHAVRVREFTVVLAPPDANQQGQNKTFTLAPGEYKFHCEHELMWTVINGADGNPLQPAADLHTGTLKSGEADVQLVAAEAAEADAVP